jgi:hypothetical protein
MSAAEQSMIHPHRPGLQAAYQGIEKCFQRHDIACAVVKNALAVFVAVWGALQDALSPTCLDVGVKVG